MDLVKCILSGMVNLPPEIWDVIGELAAFVYGEVETNFRDPFAAPPQFDIAVGVQKVLPTPTITRARLEVLLYHIYATPLSFYRS